MELKIEKQRIDIVNTYLKKLINIYFIKFNSNDLLKTCFAFGIPIAKIPSYYKMFGDFCKSYNENKIPSIFLGNNSLLKQNQVQDLIFERNNSSFIKLGLKIVDDNYKYIEPDKEKKLSDTEMKMLKEEIGILLNSIHIVFAKLKLENRELSTISIMVDVDNLTMRLKDDLTTYETNERITFNVSIV